MSTSEPPTVAGEPHVVPEPRSESDDVMTDDVMTAETAAAETATAETAAPEHRRRPRPLSITGFVLGVAFAGMSITPSLMPRAWPVEVLLSGVCLITGYGLGAFLGWAYRVLGLPVAPARAQRAIWRVALVVAGVVLLVGGVLGRAQQADQATLLGMDDAVAWQWVLAPLLGVLVAALLLAFGRAVLWCGRRLGALLDRILPRRVALLAAVVITGSLTYGLVSGVIIDGAFSAMDTVFEGNNHKDKAGVENPESTYRSGGPESAVTWESIGREGRQFIWEGPTAADIAQVVGDPEAVEPVRAFVGLDAAETASARADLAVEELRRLGGFDRRAIAVAAGTGSGWIDPKASKALEYVAHGDVAIVSTQYSYLPSWLSFLVDRQRARANAEELITAIRVALDQIPADQRPQLYVFGESLGAYSTDSAFTSVEDMSTTTDGALLIGPPGFDPTWKKLVEGRDPGSPVWQPVYGQGALARVAATDADLTDPALAWKTDNEIIYLVHGTDPVVALSADHAAWLDPRPATVSPAMVAWPVVSGWQALADMINSTGAPAGNGHAYDTTTVTAWSQIVGPPTLPAAQIEAIRAAID